MSVFWHLGFTPLNADYQLMQSDNWRFSLKTIFMGEGLLDENP
jgi:hypothetical protein